MMCAPNISFENCSINYSYPDNGPLFDIYSLQIRITRVCYVLIFILGVFGNSLVLIAMYNQKRKAAKDYFILHLAVVDLSVILANLPVRFYHTYGLPYSKILLGFLAKFVFPLSTFSVFLSIYTLVFIAWERQRTLLHPLRPRMSGKMVAGLIFAIWIISGVLTSPIVLVSKFDGFAYEENWPDNSYRKGYTLILLLFQFIIPMTIITIIYLVIGIHLHNQRLLRKSMMSQTRLAKQDVRRHQNIRVYKIFVLIVVIFGICNLPNQVIWMLAEFDDLSFLDKSVLYSFMFADILLTMSSSINPIIYGLSGMLKWKHVYGSCGTFGFFKMTNMSTTQSTKMSSLRHPNIKDEPHCNKLFSVQKQSNAPLLKQDNNK